MLKLKEFVRSGTDKEVAANLSKCAVNIRLIAEAIPIDPVNDYVGLVSQRILQSVATEVEETSKALRKDIKYFAWRTRNIFESYLLFKYIVLEKRNAEVFCAQRIADEMAILQGMLSLNPDLSGEDITQIKERAAKCKSVLEKNGFSKVAPWRVDHLAEKVGLKNEYVAFYKLYSKYVHPSSWCIVTDVEEYDNTDYWEVFILNAQLYSNACHGAGEDFLETLQHQFH